MPNLFTSNSSSNSGRAASARAWIRQGLVAAAGAVVALVLFEGLVAALGALGMVLPSDSPRTRAPHAEFEFSGNYFEFPDFRNQVRLNGQGFHDRERENRAPEGVFRVAVWGDSLVEGFQVPVESLFTSLLESEFRGDAAGNSAKSTEILNLGSSGSRATSLASARVQDYLRSRDVNALVVVLHGIMELSHLQSGGGEGLLPPDISKLEQKPSAIRQLFVEKLGLDSPVLLWTHARRIVADGTREQRPPQYFFFAHEVDAPGREQAWQRLDALLGDLAALQRGGTPTAVVYAPTYGEVVAVRSDSVRTLSPLRVELDFDTIARHVHAAAEAHGIEVWDTTAALALPDGDTHFRSDKHWTAEGHRRVATALAPRIGPWIQSLQRGAAVPAAAERAAPVPAVTPRGAIASPGPAPE